jgi:hypothetical protein
VQRRNATITPQDWLAGNNNALGAQALGAGSIYDTPSLIPGAGLPIDPTVPKHLVAEQSGGRNHMNSRPTPIRHTGDDHAFGFAASTDGESFHRNRQQMRGHDRADCGDDPER